MRRVSIGILLLIVAPGITQGYYSNISHHYRVRYSPYAFSYHSNGLVPGGFAYTPYAFGFGTTGLAFEGLRYSPYALTYSESGLVLDYYLYPIPYVSYCPPYPPCQAYREYERTPSCDKDRRMPRPYSRTTGYSVQQARTYTPSSPDSRPTQARQQDALAVIRQHLRDVGIQDARVDRILRIDNKLVSADFTLTDRNLLIKYWDPEQIESLSANSPFSRRAIEKYQQDWKQFAEQYQSNGGRVYAISVSDSSDKSDRDDLVAALRSCVETQNLASPPGDDSSDQHTMYARN